MSETHIELGSCRECGVEETLCEHILDEETNTIISVRCEACVSKGYEEHKE